MILIQNGNVFTMEKPGCEVMDILVDAGKIIEMGEAFSGNGRCNDHRCEREEYLSRFYRRPLSFGDGGNRHWL